MRALSLLQRLTPTLVLAIAGTLFAVAPASAALCGEPFDTAPIVKLTIATYPKIGHATRAIDASYIRIVSVNGTYAYSQTDIGSERIPFYWEKPTGTWHLASVNRAPADWDKMIVSFLQDDGNCTNPNWKKRS